MFLSSLIIKTKKLCLFFILCLYNCFSVYLCTTAHAVHSNRDESARCTEDIILSSVVVRSLDGQTGLGK